MSTAKRSPQDEPDVPEARTGTGAEAPQQDAPFDWQVLLLRYLPEPRGSTHVIKRLVPR